MRINLPARSDSPARARRFVEQALVNRCPQALVDAAALLATELVTNAVRHAHTEMTLEIEASRDGVRLEVSDGSKTMPAMREHSTGAHGRGLLLVNRIAEAWGTEPRPDGKSVWAQLTPQATDTAFTRARRSAPWRDQPTG